VGVSEEYLRYLCYPFGDKASVVCSGSNKCLYLRSALFLQWLCLSRCCLTCWHSNILSALESQRVVVIRIPMQVVFCTPSRVYRVKYVLDCVDRHDGYLWNIQFRSSARGASFHTKHASSANVVRIVLLDANSYLALVHRINNPQSVGKRTHDLMDSVSAKKRWKTICWRVNKYL
jgi:hypothetical protein